MGPNGKHAGRGDPRLEFVSGSDVRGPRRGGMNVESGLVFDFTGLNRPGLCDLSLILTARLQASPDERVWVRALPDSTWTVLRALGLDHLFHLLPGPGAVRN